MARVPHGYHDLAAIAARSGGRRLRAGAVIRHGDRRASRAASARDRGDGAIARARRCAARSRRATRRGSSEPPTSPPRRSPRASAPARSTARSRRTSSRWRNERPALAMSRIAGIDVGGTFTDSSSSTTSRRGAARQGADDGRQPGLRRPRRARRRRCRAGLARRHRARHDDDDQRDARAQDRARRPDHDARLPRRARARPANAADALRPEGPLRAADPARAAPRGRRAHGCRGRRCCVPLDEAGVAAAGAAAARAGCRERRHPLPAQLPQPGPRGARRGDRPRALWPNGYVTAGHTRASPSTASTSAARRRR